MDLHGNHWIRQNRITPMAQSKGKASARMQKPTVPKGSVLEAARRFKREQGLKFVDGEKQ
jgi:hypothetical protein